MGPNSRNGQRYRSDTDHASDPPSPLPHVSKATSAASHYPLLTFHLPVRSSHQELPQFEVVTQTSGTGIDLVRETRIVQMAGGPPLQPCAPAHCDDTRRSGIALATQPAQCQGSEKPRARRLPGTQAAEAPAGGNQK